MSNAVLVYIVAANDAEAEAIAMALVEERLAACVNILGSVRWVYRWKGGIERATEVAMIAKSTRAAFERLEMRVRALHSYETPAIVALRIETGGSDYLGWIAAELSAS